MLHRPALFASVALATCLGGGAASAQSAETPPQVGEVVVTALKREAALQDIPASISAMSGEAMARQGIENVQDLSKFVPNLVWGEHFGTSLVTIRGVGSSVNSGVTEPTIAMYVDGVYLPRSDMAMLRAVDLDRVEVLRGPQGTLYGRNATGGAINFVSAAPSATFEGKVELMGGARDEYGASGYVGGPIAPGILVRLSGGREKQDGYVKVLNTGQRLAGVNATYGRIAIRLEPQADLTVDLSARYDRNTAPVAFQQLFEPSPIAPPGGFTAEPDKIIADYPFSSKKETLILAGVVNWKISDEISFRSVTGYIDHKGHDQVDDDSTIIPALATDDFRRTSESWSQEFNLIGDHGDVSWILGAYYFRENYHLNLPVILPGTGTINNGAGANIENAALYGDVTYSFTDKLRLNVGLRYNHEDNDYYERWSFVPLAGPIVGNFKKKSDKFLPKIALQYDLAPDVHTYVQWSRGYKSGGVNLPGGDGTIFPLYGPEKLDAYEVGLKSQFLDRRVTADVAFYYYDYGGLQITKNIPPATTFIENADAKIYGVEGDFRWEVTDQLTLNVAPTLQHAVFQDFVTFDSLYGNTVDLDGEPLLRAPKFTINAGAEYRVDLGGQLLSKLYLQGNIFHSSTVILRYQNQNPLERQKPYTLLNLSATIVDAGEKTRLTAFLNNATDEHYKQHSDSFGLGYMGNYGPPRTWGVRLSRMF